MGEDTMGEDLMDLGAGATPGQGFPSSPKPTPSGAGGGLLMRRRSDDLWVRKLIDELVARASTGSVAGASAVPPSSSSKPLAADDDNKRLPEEDELGMEPSGSSAFDIFDTTGTDDTDDLGFGDESLASDSMDSAGSFPPTPAGAASPAGGQSSSGQSSKAKSLKGASLRRREACNLLARTLADELFARAAGQDTPASVSAPTSGDAYASETVPTPTPASPAGGSVPPVRRGDYNYYWARMMGDALD
ncbi:uncharacterized protein C8Q71DRAFT_862893 [Rhodofomes roseus]|uniref:Uncharacterized protein n=1 Tax=Rhodofomes roseus TaxID=34475 RepID=A0ABQ8K086_9APHY|nr:uncharacterized protein C8Q71DRAFT_862893 [Rhodofomes roseus]KAH9830036.1 hypothetical protein C8Q71DRAFT_862893 [Rhodofomes roseus]